MSRRYSRLWAAVAALATGTAVTAAVLAAGGSSADVVRLRADVARLAAAEWQGRRAGTEGADRAAEWIADEFRRIGLAPGATDGSYFQSFQFIDGVDLGPGNRLAVSGAPALVAGRDFRPLAFSAPGSVAAEVVFAGYGIVAPELDYDDYAGVDVRGRVVLLLRMGPDADDPESPWAAFTSLRYKASTARDKGAAGVLVTLGPRTEGDELVPLRSDASLADAGLPVVSVTRSVADALLSGSGASLAAAQREIDESSRPGPQLLEGAHVELVADLTPRRSTTRNVIGVLPGTGSPETLVVGAHYDHLGLGGAGSREPGPEQKVHPGADDNASGVAGMLELARRMAARPPGPSRGLAFVAFGAEELGVLGSAHFVEHSPFPWSGVAAMVNLDMIGRLRGDTLDLHGVGTSPAWKVRLEFANRDLGLTLRYHEGGHGPSDHAAFYAAGRPVLAAFTGVHQDYHRASDTADKVDAVGMERVVTLLERVVADLARAPGPVAFTRVPGEREAAARGRGFRVWVGGVPDYGSEGVGVKFTAVTPGSPAQKAGVRSGDVLVHFGAKQIRNIYDYTYALGERRPGDRVRVVVRRGGRDLVLDLTLRARPGAAE